MLGRAVGLHQRAAGVGIGRSVFPANEIEHQLSFVVELNTEPIPPDLVFVGGYGRTTFTIGSFGGCGVDSASVNVSGAPLGYARVKVRTPDFAPPYCAIDVTDFAFFTNLYYGYPVPVVDDCRDFDNNGQVNTVDWYFFATHYVNHYGQTCSAGSAPQEATSANASVALRLTEEYPTATTHRLYVDIDVENFAGVTTSLFALARDNERLTFVEWLPSANSPGNVLFASKVRDGLEHLVVGLAASEPLTDSTVRLGRLVFEVTGTQPFRSQTMSSRSW